MSKPLTKQDLQKLTESRNHTLISSENYQNVHSRITVQCNVCSEIWSPTVHSYKNAKQTGCPGCKKQVASNTHKGKVTSQEH